MNKLRISVLIANFFVAIFYQPNWVYYNFYFNPKWVDNAWWSTSYWFYLAVYAILSTILVECVIRFVKKYL
jgi:hypothetical protein